MSSQFDQEQAALQEAYNEMREVVLDIPEQPLCKAKKGDFVLLSGEGSRLWTVKGPATVIGVPIRPEESVFLKRQIVGRNALVRVIPEEIVEQSRQIWCAEEELNRKRKEAWVRS